MLQPARDYVEGPSKEKGRPVRTPLFALGEAIRNRKLEGRDVGIIRGTMMLPGGEYNVTDVKPPG